MESGQTATAKSNIHGAKLILCIWWDLKWWKRRKLWLLNAPILKNLFSEI